MLSTNINDFRPESANIHLHRCQSTWCGSGHETASSQQRGKACRVFFLKVKQNSGEKKAIYLECPAIKECIKYWQHKLIAKKFTVFSDHKPLENMNIKSRTNEELGDLTYYLSQYDFEVKYSPGKYNLEADCLSRNPVL